MVIKNKPHSEITIDLTGPEGNVFFLMGKAQQFAKELGLDGKKIVADMMSSDYDHAVDVFEEHFGSFVTLYR
jgi:hypothetical protein